MKKFGRRRGEKIKEFRNLGIEGLGYSIADCGFWISDLKIIEAT
jgi:hypothetical protein